MNERLSQIKQVTKKFERPPSLPPLFESLDQKILTDRISQLENLTPEQLTQDKKLLMGRLFEKQKYQDDQYHLLAHLFLTIRNGIPKDKFDEKRELANIGGVLDLLTDDTPEKKTGRGKSSVIVPIEIFLRCFWSDEKIVQITSPPHRTLVKEIIKNYQSLVRRFSVGLPQIQKEKIAKLTKFNIDQSKNTSSDNSFTASMTGIPVDIIGQSLSTGARVVFQTHNQTIFYLINASEQKPDGEKFIPPPILFDEIHQLTDEQFISSTGSSRKRLEVVPENFSGTMVGDDVSLFVLYKLLYQKLSAKQKNNFYYSGNELGISTKGYKVINKLKKSLTDGTLDTDLNDIIGRFVLPGFIFKKKDRQAITDTIFTEVKKLWMNVDSRSDLQGDNGKSPKDFFLENLSADIGRIMSGVKKGEKYTTEKDRIIVREAGRGIILPSHEFDKDTNRLITVVDDKLSYRYQSSARLRYSFSFTSWLYQMTGGRVQGLTANLLNQDLPYKKYNPLEALLKRLEQKILETDRSSLVGGIDSFTQGYSIPDTETNADLPLPKPKIFKNINALKNRLAQGKSDHNQDLIICYNDLLAIEIAKKINDTNVGVIISTTPELEVEKIIRLFSQGKIKKIITSGKAGYGVNIIKPDKSFPDFHITIINPNSQTDINQGFGRLRGEKTVDNFSIFLTKDFLEQLSTLFFEKKPYPLFYYHTKKEFQKLILEYQKGEDQEKFMKLFLELLKKNNSESSGDYAFKTELELNFHLKVAPVISEIKKGILKKFIADENTPLSRLLGNEFGEDEQGKFARKMTIKALLDNFSLPEEDFLEMFFLDARLLQNDQSLSVNDTAFFSKLIDRWYENMVEDGSPLRIYFENIFNSPEYLRIEMSDFLRKNHIFYDQISPLILKQIPFDSFDLQDVTNVGISPLPRFVKNPNSRREIKIYHPENFVKIGKNKYLISIPDKTNHKSMLFIWEGESPPVKGTKISVFMADIKASGIENKQNLFGKNSSPVEGNYYLVLPSIAALGEKIATHALAVQAKIDL